MALLIVGLLLFGIVHAVPVWMPQFRAVMAARLGEWPWKGVFSLASLVGFVLIVQGWQQSDPVFLYDLGPGARHGLYLLMPIAFAFFVASYAKSNLTRLVRNQQYTAVKLWAVGHLLANGDSRSVLLFGGMLAWAVIMVIGVKKKRGDWIKPAKSPIWRDIATAVIAVLATGAVMHLHPTLFGVSVLP